MFLYVCLPLFLYTQLGEERLWAVSLVVAVPAAGRWAAASFWGRRLDRWGRQRPFMLLGLGAYGAILAVLPLLQNTYTIWLATGMAALVTSAYNPAVRAWLTLGSGGHGVRLLARWHQWETLGYFVGSTWLGWAVVARPELLPALLGAGALLCWACGLWLALAVPDRAVALARRGAGRAGPGRKIIPWPVPIFILTAFLMWDAVATVFGVYFTQHLKGSALLYGITLGGATFAGLLAYGPLAVLSGRRSPENLFQGAAWGYTAMYLLLVLRSPWLVSLGYAVPMVAVCRTAVNALLTRRVAEDQRGRALGELEAAEAAAAAVGPLLGGLLAHHLGLQTVPRAALAGSLLLHLLALHMAAAKGGSVVPKD